ncbi:hypothetical protein [Microbacterium sp.]|uniref:hypothetical protein n=1 Tax=Microbacterium sp. TaxID=51671 RepID=UPI003C752671
MKRVLGRTGREVAPLGLGCMGMSWGYAESGRDDERSVAVIRQAFDAGVEVIDPASPNCPSGRATPSARPPAPATSAVPEVHTLNGLPTPAGSRY